MLATRQRMMLWILNLRAYDMINAVTFATMHNIEMN